MSTSVKKAESLRKVIETLDILRVKCPWDAKQTNESLRTNTVEEVYELCDALIKEDDDNIKKELGDVLLHVLFYSKIGEEKGKFDIGDVAEALNSKLISVILMCLVTLKPKLPERCHRIGNRLS